MNNDTAGDLADKIRICQRLWSNHTIYRERYSLAAAETPLPKRVRRVRTSGKLAVRSRNVSNSRCFRPFNF